jgi:hypothetical protein
MIKNVYGIDTLDKDFMNDHYRSEGQLFNLISLIDIKNYPICVDDNKNIEGLMRVQYVKQIINDLGFKHVFDDVIIPKEVFDESVEKCVSSNPYFKDPKITCILFSSIKTSKVKPDNNKKVLGYLNTVFDGFGIKISKVQKRVKGQKNLANFYRLEILNDLPELIQYRINRGKQFIDTDGIFKYDASNSKLNHLIRPRKNKYIDYDADDFIDDIDEVLEVKADEKPKEKSVMSEASKSEKAQIKKVIEEIREAKIDYLKLSMDAIYKIKVGQLKEIGADYDDKTVLKNIKSVYEDEDICDEDKLDAYTNTERFKRGKIFVI